MVLGLLLAAAPATAKTFYGDVYIGISFGSMTSLMQGMDLGGLSPDMTGQLKLPFRAKVYYQDGILRLDAELPSMGSLADAGVDKPAGSSQVLSLLIDYETSDLVLLNHASRRAYRLTVPPELQKLIRPKDPMAVLTSKEFVEAFNQEGVKYLGTKRLKARSFSGLKADGIEMSFRVMIPQADLAEMKEAGIDFDSRFTLQFYLEKETQFPLLYKIDSSIFSAVFQLANLKRDRLPDVLFDIPAFYAVESYTVDDLERLMKAVTRDIGLGETFTVPPEVVEELKPEEAPQVPPRPEVGELDESEKAEGEDEETQDGDEEEDKREPIVPPAMYG